VTVLIPLLDRWARSAQLQARRNAMIASTRLTQRRVEREEVDRYLASRFETGATRPAQVVAGR
jgi:hypothetical protein